MTDTAVHAPAAARDALRARIEAAERRNAERSLADQARSAAEAATDYARAHPLTVIGGALALGLLIGLATPSGRRFAGRAMGAVSTAASGVAGNTAAGVRSVTGKGGARVSHLLGEAVMSYALTVVDEMLEARRAAQEQIEDIGHDAVASARKAGEAVGAAAEETRRSAARAAKDAARRLKR